MRLRRAGIVVGAVVGTLVALLILAHAPFVRRAVLRYAQSVLQRDFGLTLVGERLDYNLIALRAGVTNARVSAEGSSDEPFFEADAVSLTVSPGSLFGDVTIRGLDVTNARVRIHQRADGTSNLPRSTSGQATEPSPLPVDRLDVSRLAIDVIDEANDLRLQAPAVHVQLARDAGAIALVEPLVLRVGDRSTTVSAFRADAAFDGRTLRTSNGELRSDELAATFAGALTLIARVPSLDLQLMGNADVARLARWGMAADDVPQGTMAFNARVDGTLADPRARIDLSSPRLAMGDVPVTDLSARAMATRAALVVETLSFGFASGRVTGNVTVPFTAGSQIRVESSWSGVDLSSATRVFQPGLSYLPSGASAGTLTATGVGADAVDWRADVRLRVGTSRNTRSRIGVPGETTMTLDRGQWQLAARHVVAGAAPVVVTARGRLGAGQAPSDATVDDGLVTLDATMMPALLSALREVGVTGLEQGMVTEGVLKGSFTLNGSVANPETAGSLDIAGAAGEGFRVDSIRADFAGHPAQSAMTFTVDAPTVTVSGQDVRDLRASGRLSGPANTGRGRSATSPGNSLVLDAVSASQPDGPGRLSGTASYDVASGRYVASITGTDWRVVATPEQPASGVVDLRFSGMGTADAPGGSGEMSVRDAVWDGTALGPLTASVRLAGRSAADIEVHAPEFSTTATARVALSAPYDAVVDVRAVGADLARVLRGVATPTPIGGVLTGSLHFEGAPEAWSSGTARVEVSSLEATAGDLPVRLAEPAVVRMASEQVHVDRLEATAGGTALSASGALPIRTGAAEAAGLLVVMTGGIQEVAKAVAATGLSDVPLTGGSGPVALLARVGGSVQSPVYEADLEIGPGSITLEGLPPVSEIQIRAHAGSGQFELREGVASYQSARVTATGRAPLSWVQPSAVGAGSGGELHARATNVTAAVLAPFLDRATLAQMTGSIDATVSVASATPDLRALTGELQIDRLDVRVADLPITQRVPTRIVVRDGIARVDAWDWTGQGASLSVSGQVGLVEDRQLAVLARGSVDLRLLDPFTRDAGLTTTGRFEPLVALTGPFDRPRVDGEATISDGEIRLADPRVLVSDLTARATFSGTSAKIVSIAGSMNGGTLTGTGSVGYTAQRALVAQLATSVRGAALEFPDGLRSEIDGDLTMVAGMPAGRPASGRLSGTVTVVRGSYREPLAVVTGMLSGLRTRALTAGGGTPGLLSALALDVRLLTDEDIIVDNNYGRAQLGADLRVIGTAAVPALSGRAELREGGQLFIGRNVYAVNFGVIDFSNPVVIEPNLNIQASTRAGGEDIEVRITGLAQSPSVDLRSITSPELGQAEVASLLLTGRRLEDLAPGDAAFVGTQVLSNFSGEVLGFASRAVGLDTIRLGGGDDPAARRDPTAAETTLDPTTRLTFGKSVGSAMDVTFSQSLRNSDAQAWIVNYAVSRALYDGRRGPWLIEYVFRRGLELRLVSNDDDLRSYGFRQDVTFGGTARPTQSGAQPRDRAAMRIAEVNVSGDLALPETRVRGALHVSPGDRFDFAEWQADRDRLEALYRREGYVTARISARRSDGAGGVVLAYDIAAGRSTRITIVGTDLSSALRGQIEDAWAGAVSDEFVVEEASQLVRADLARRGYLRPSVNVAVRVAGEEATLEVMVERGPRSGRTTVRLDGVADALAHEVDLHLAATNVMATAVSDPGQVEREVTAFLRAKGFLRARVMTGEPLFEDNTAVLPVLVEPGPVVTITSVDFAGAASLPMPLLQDATQLTVGSPYDGGALELAREAVESLYRREGFRAATVTARATVADVEPSAEVVFVVEEGARDVLAEVVVAGNRTIDADVVLRGVDLMVGSPVRIEDVLQARTRVFGSGLFRRIDIASEPLDVPATEETVPIRLRVTVEEWPGLRLRYGFLVSEERGTDTAASRHLVPGFSADISRRTLFGRAFAVGAAVGVEQRERRARLFVNTPTLFGWPVESSLIGERSHEAFEGVTFVTDRNRVTWEQRVRAARRLSLSYAYTYERNRTFDTKPNDASEFLFDVRINIARLNAAVAWDTRDNPLDTTRGVLASSAVELASETLGSDIRFVRQVAQAYYFRPWRGVVLASAARLGTVTPLGDQEVIPSERFFAGGSRTVRGVLENGLGPVDSIFGGAAGGNLMLVFNQEARVPVYRWVRGVLFVDAGNVFAEPRDTRLRDLIGSFGIGLRLSTPFALLRVDYGKAVWGASPTIAGATSTAATGGRWTFGIGHAF